MASFFHFLFFSYRKNHLDSSPSNSKNREYGNESYEFSNDISYKITGLYSTILSWQLSRRWYDRYNFCMYLNHNRENISDEKRDTIFKKRNGSRKSTFECISFKFTELEWIIFHRDYLLKSKNDATIDTIQ